MELGLSRTSRRILTWFPIALGSLYTLGLLVYSYRFSTFVGDDLSAFWLLHRLSFGAFLIESLGGQLVVLHRLLTLVIYDAAPMNFLPAIVILGALHLLGAAYIYKTLELFKPSRVNGILAAYYSMSVFIGIQLTWWSSGLTRFGYIACAAIAIYHYLLHARTGQARHIAVVIIASILSLGFYAKGVLIPVYCVAIDLATREKGRKTSLRAQVTRVGTLGLLFALGLVYSSVARALLPPFFRRVNTDVGFLSRFVAGCWGVFGTSLFDRVLGMNERPPPLLMGVLVAFFVYSSWRFRGALWVWAVAAALVTLNFLVVGVSNRTLLWHEYMIYEYRHYFEVLLFFVPLLGVVLHGLEETTEGRWLSSQSPLASSAAVLALLCLHGALSTKSLLHLLQTEPVYSSMPDARRYLGNLRGDLQKLAERSGPAPAFLDSGFPAYLDPMDFGFGRQWQLFVVLGARARFVPDASAHFRVADDGHIVYVRPTDDVRQ